MCKKRMLLSTPKLTYHCVTPDNKYLNNDLSVSMVAGANAYCKSSYVSIIVFNRIDSFANILFIMLVKTINYTSSR